MRRWDNKQHEQSLQRRRQKEAVKRYKPTPHYDTSTKGNNGSSAPSTKTVAGNERYYN